MLEATHEPRGKSQLKQGSAYTRASAISENRSLDADRLAIDAYVSTYTSLLRSSGEVFVAALEDAHVASSPVLHPYCARDDIHDVHAFGYGAARLPSVMPLIRRIVLAQSHEQFEAAGFPVREWKRLRTPGRRRPLRWGGGDTLAVFLSSTSDIDDLVPIVTAYQIEWNKLHARLRGRPFAESLRNPNVELSMDTLRTELDLESRDVFQLMDALGPRWRASLVEISSHPCDLSIRLLASSHAEYMRAAQRWWSGVEVAYVREELPHRRPIYFVSSNTHSLANLLGGYARSHREQITTFTRKTNPEGLLPLLEQALANRDEAQIDNLTYYLLRAWMRHSESVESEIMEEVQHHDAAGGVHSLYQPGQLDVNAQIIELARLKPDRLDSRLSMPNMARLAQSDAVIMNIDYPLGLAAYHLLSRLAQGTNEVRGVYIMGKAAMLNGRVGDVAVLSNVRDEHSGNTFILRNCFRTQELQPFMKGSRVYDNQRAVTVRGTFLQNPRYLGALQREGVTVLEMEAGPYLSAVYELALPDRHPVGETVVLGDDVPFEVGMLHYASDTPQSKRQSLLSKSMSFFGVSGTSACAIAIVRRILAQEIKRNTVS